MGMLCDVQFATYRLCQQLASPKAINGSASPHARGQTSVILSPVN